MIYLRAKLRYLAALGLPALAIPMFACSGGGTGTTNTTPSATPTTTEPAGSATATATTPAETATATGVATAAPTATATTTATATSTAQVASWEPEKDPRPQPKPGAHHLPSCPSGLVCVVQPASLGGAAAAPAPYASCAAEAELPKDSALVGRVLRTTFHAQTTAQERKKNPAACCYEWVRPCPGGRPLRGAEGDILAEATGRSDWLVAIGDIGLLRELSPADRAFAAEHFAREAAFEHASIAAFSRAAMGLLGLGAPAELVSETHAAALDEVEHARIAFSLASAFGGAARGPSKLDVTGQAPLPASLPALAVETFVDACVGEAVAALALREAAASAGEAVIAALLSSIADDEERHAELAWRTVAWALRAGGAPVREALGAAMQAVREEAPMPVEAVGWPDLRACGIPGAGALLEVRERAIREVVLPCAAALLASSERDSRTSERSSSTDLTGAART